MLSALAPAQLVLHFKLGRRPPCRPGASCQYSTGTVVIPSRLTPFRSSNLEQSKICVKMIGILFVLWRFSRCTATSTAGIRYCTVLPYRRSPAALQVRLLYRSGLEYRRHWPPREQLHTLKHLGLAADEPHCQSNLQCHHVNRNESLTTTDPI